jgi:hypothetical protein
MKEACISHLQKKRWMVCPLLCVEQLEESKIEFVLWNTMNKKQEGLSTLLTYIITGRSHGIEMPIDFLYRKINTLSKIMTTLFVQRKGEREWI